MKPPLTSRLGSSSSETPPLLFVHGAWHGAWCWDEHFLGLFADAGYDAYALDLRGHGVASENMRLISNDDYLSDIESAVDELGTPPVLIGHSMGGYLVQRYLESHEVPAAVLVASVPPHGVFGVTMRLLRSQPKALLKTQLQLRLWPLVATPELARDVLMRSDATDADAQLLQSKLQDESFRAFLGMLVRRTKKPQSLSPILVLGAEQDRIISVAEVEATAQRYGTDAVVLADMSHDMMLDPDWKLAGDVILTWLGEVLEDS